ncbi:hypothetical protein [Streptomyces sp. NPDC057682]|uniref:hypothetical protein n=1 Tax=unclassified Streptomyces TaxID=2593676 RepID=UPI0036471EDE
MELAGSTMGDDPSWGELLLGFVIVGVVPLVIGGAVLLSVIGLAMWATAPLRRRARERAEAVEPGAEGSAPGSGS